MNTNREPVLITGMIMIILIMIMIALKGAILDFYNLLTARRTVSNTYAQAAMAES